MLLFYYANRYAWLECLFGRSDGEKTRKMPYCGWGAGAGGGGVAARREPVNLEVWPNIQGTGHFKAVSLSNEKA